MQRHPDPCRPTDDPAQETAAVDLYRRNRRDIYGAKLALSTRTRPWQAPGGGAYAAQLITGGEKGAVRFLQGELGKVALVDSSEQLRVGHKALSRDGMVSSGGGIDRLCIRAGRTTAASCSGPSDLCSGCRRGRQLHAGWQYAIKNAEFWG